MRLDAPAFDDLATWTGSVVRHRAGGGSCVVFYTGASLNSSGANVQSNGYAVSADLMTWDKAPVPMLSANPRWYETFADGNWQDEEFREPWVFADPDGDGWHMLTTARANHGDVVDRGVVGPPFVVDGRDVLLFNCLVGDMPEAARAGG